MNKDKLSERFTEKELEFIQLNIKNFLLLNYLLKLMKSRTDQEISKHSENNTLIFKPNTKKHNKKNQDLKVIASKELAKTEPRLIDLSENSTKLSLITSKLRMNKLNF